MFCCFGDRSAVKANCSEEPEYLNRIQRQERQNVSQSSEPPKAVAHVNAGRSPSGEGTIKETASERGGCEVAQAGPLLGERGPVAPRPQQNVWFSLVDGLRHPLRTESGAVEAAFDTLGREVELRLPAGGTAIPISELIQQADTVGDPLALVLFERTAKRAIRSRRISPHLLMDINIEALFAGGVVPPTLQNPASAVPVSATSASHQALLHLLQRMYCRAEAIRMTVHYGNSALMSLMGCSSADAYEGLLAELLAVEHVLRAMLHDCCLCMLEGVTATSSQIMVHHPITGLGSRVVLPISVHPVIMWRRPSDSHPSSPENVPTIGVVLRYNLSAGLQASLLQLHRVYAMLSSLAGIVTLFTLRGRVLHQNAASIRYMGLRQELTPADRAPTDPTGVDARGLSRGSILQQIFALSGDDLEDMLEDVVEGKTWKGIVRVPPLLTPTLDPGPAHAAVLAARGTGISGYTSLGASQQPGEGTSQGQMLTTWDRLGPVLLSTQAQLLRASTMAAQSDADGMNSDLNALPSALLNTQTEAGGSVCGGGGGGGGPATGAGMTRMGTAGHGGDSTGGTQAGYGNGGAGGGRVRGGNALNMPLGDGSNPDSCFMLAIGSTNGTTFSRMHMSNLGAQSSSARAKQQHALGGGSSAEQEGTTHHAASALAVALSAPSTPPTVPSSAPHSNVGASKLRPAGAGSGPAAGAVAYGTSAPVVPPNPRAQSAVRMTGTSLLRTLMENGAGIMNELESAAAQIGGGGGGGGVAIGTATGGGLGVGYGGGEDSRNGLSLGLTDAARRSIMRRRSALRLMPTEDNPLSTSTWGLLEAGRGRHESRSFSVRLNGANKSQLKRMGTEVNLDRSLGAGSNGAASTLGLGGGGGGGLGGFGGGGASGPNSGAGGLGNSRHSGSKRRPPSRLMSFLANKNIGGSHKALGNNILSTSVTEGSPAAGAAEAQNKAISSTTELEIGSRMGSSAGAGVAAVTILTPGLAAPQQLAGSAPTAMPAALLGLSPPFTTARDSASPRRPPGRRIMRPAIEDVVEESDREASASLTPLLRPHSESPFAAVCKGAVVHAVPAQAPVPAAASAAPLGAPQSQALLSAAALGGSVLSQLTCVMSGSCGSSSSHPSQHPSHQLTAHSQQGEMSQGGVGRGGPNTLPSNTALSALGSTSCQTLAPIGTVLGSERGSATGDDDDDCWHEITASTLKDPVTGEQTLLLMQVDVSARVKAERRIAEVLEAEHKLLESVFPRHVLEMAATQHTKDASSHRRGLVSSKFSLAELPLAQNCASVATYHPQVTILFSDIIGFTSMCHELPATKVMQFLNNLYSRLDTLLDVYGVYKVETIGDCYMVAGGLMTRDADGFMTVRGSDSLDELHAAKVMSFAKAMLRETAEVLLPTTGEPVQMRIGLHSGPVMSGIVGSKMPRFCLFGDTVNTASRMESTCPPGCIHVSVATRDCLPDEDWEPTGGVMVKGKGQMATFRWVPLEVEASPQVRAGSGGRQNRPRRASSVAYIQTGGQCRDLSGGYNVSNHAALLAQIGMPGAMPGANGVTSLGVASIATGGIASGNSSAAVGNNSTLLEGAPGGMHVCISPNTTMTGVLTGSRGNSDNVAGAAAQAPLQQGHRADSATVAFMTSLVVVTGANGLGGGGGVGPSLVNGTESGAGATAGGERRPVESRATLTHIQSGANGPHGSSGPSRGLGAGSDNLASLRRKPHRTCSTTALAYRGLAAGKPI